MFKNTQILILIFCIFSVQAQDEQKSQKKSKNFLKNFNPKQIEDLVKKFEFVMIGYVDRKSHLGRKIEKALKIVSQQHQDQKNFFWTWVDLKKMPQDIEQKLDIQKKNEIHLYFQQHKKTYHGKKNADDLYNWFLEIQGAQVNTKQEYKDLNKVDSHYFVYASEPFYEKNKKNLEILAKLVYPIQIVKGFKNLSFAKLFKRSQKVIEFFLYREYQNVQVELKDLGNLLQVADYIEQNEFPDVMKPDKKSLKLILQFKIPVAIYFTQDRKDKNIKMIQDLAKKHKDYFLYMYVACNKKCKKYKKFMKNFMGIKSQPTLRMLNVKQKVQRYKFLGDFDKDVVDYFFSNYLNSHLKPYYINQKLSTRNEKFGIEKTNTKNLKQILQKFDEFTLIYVYTQLKKKTKTKQHLEVLKQIKDAYSINDYFRIYTLNNDKNDFRGRRSNSLPVLILKPRSNQLVAYQGDFDFESIQNFMMKYNKHLAVKLTNEL